MKDSDIVTRWRVERITLLGLMGLVLPALTQHPMSLVLGPGLVLTSYWMICLSVGADARFSEKFPQAQAPSYAKDRFSTKVLLSEFLQMMAAVGVFIGVFGVVAVLLSPFYMFSEDPYKISSSKTIGIIGAIIALLIFLMIRQFRRRRQSF